MNAERERERQRQRDREREREKERSLEAFTILNLHKYVVSGMI